MMKNVNKYGLMTIAAVLLVAMAFAGAASADIIIKNSSDWQTKLAGQEVTDNVILENDIDFSGATISMISSLSGTFDGKNHTISNFVINGYGQQKGLIGTYKGTLIKDLTLSDFSVIGDNFDVGGLVGDSLVGMHIENVHVQYGNVTSRYLDAGGLVGYVAGATWINASSAEHMYVSGSDSRVAGLLANANSEIPIYIIDSWVNCSEMHGGNDVGGILGISFGSATVSMNNASVMDCMIVSAGGNNVGGLVGNAKETPINYEGCAVENCTITGSGNVGGLIGTTSSSSTFTGGVTWVNATWVGGTSNVGALLGHGIGSKTPATATNPLHNNVWGSMTVTNTSGNGFDESPKTLDEAKSAGYCSVIDKKSLIAGKDYGNCRAKHLTYDPNGATSGSAPASQVYPYNSTAPVATVADNVNLARTGYLFDGWNTAADGSGISYQPGDTFPITADTTLYVQWMKVYSTITNATDTYHLTSALMTVCGDYGMDNGTAVLTFDRESKPVLTLTGFKASNMSGVPIIYADVADLTIVLKGESKLTGSFEDTWGGVLTVDGNLAIEGDSSSKLLVDNTNSVSSSRLISIYVDDDLTINGAKVTATATSTSRYAYSIYAGNDISIGKNSVVEATATSTSSDAYSIYAANDIEIESAKIVNATAESLGSEYYDDAYGLYAGGAIAITDSQDVTATATAPYAYSIMADDYYHSPEKTYDIVIANSKVTAKADGKYNAFALWCDDGSITITGDKTVIDANATSTGQAGSAAGAIFANEDITITSAERIKAIGTNSSFVYNGSGYGSLNLNKLADYKFSNASVDGDEPKTYSTFVNPNNWYYSGSDTVSNFTAVLIEKKATTPSSSSKQTGSTVILPNTAGALDAVDTTDAADTSANMYTVNFSMNGHGIQVMNQSVSFGNTADEPSPVPTAEGYTFTGWYTDKGLVSKYAFSTPVTDDIELYAGWTAKTPTSKSPAPVVGLLAGLGAAALVLGRLRR